MEEDIPVRYTFVMLLAISDQEGLVVGTDIALARRLNMPLDEFVNCVKTLHQPDENSNSKDEDGRRLLPSDGERGYQIVNFVKYRNIKSDTEKREYMREYMRKRRSKVESVNSCKVLLTDVKNVTHTEAEAEEDTEAEEEVQREVEVAPRSSSNLNREIEPEVEAWNKLNGFPKVKHLSPGRKKHLKERRKDPYFRENWRAAIEKIAESDFCQGVNTQGWVADFDFFLRQDAVTKIMEGKYDNRVAKVAEIDHSKGF